MQHKKAKVFIIFSWKYMKANLVNAFIFHWIHHSSIYTIWGRNKILKKCFKMSDFKPESLLFFLTSILYLFS